MRVSRLLVAIGALSLAGCWGAFALQAQAAEALKVLPPRRGMYHSAYPGFGLQDDEVSAESVRRFAAKAQKGIAWSYVAFHWNDGIRFPVEACRTLHAEGIVPLVGIMPWSTRRQGQPESVYTLERILRGDFDWELTRCAEDVRALGFPIMIEFGPEVNGSWFPWNGVWNGRDADEYGERGVADGPERFRDAYRHIVDIFRANGARDVTWVFHAALDGAPQEAWNEPRNYYPGDAWVDWIGVSLYGRLRNNGAGNLNEPLDALERAYLMLLRVSPQRPMALLEFGTTEHGAKEKARWIDGLFREIRSGRYTRIKAVSWWNKPRRPDGKRSHLEIDSSRESLDAYRKGVGPLLDKVDFYLEYTP
jgi:Beta-mannanase